MFYCRSFFEMFGPFLVPFSEKNWSLFGSFRRLFPWGTIIVTTGASSLMLSCTTRKVVNRPLYFVYFWWISGFLPTNPTMNRMPGFHPSYLPDMSVPLPMINTPPENNDYFSESSYTDVTSNLNQLDSRIHRQFLFPDEELHRYTSQHSLKCRAQKT